MIQSYGYHYCHDSPHPWRSCFIVALCFFLLLVIVTIVCLTLGGCVSSLTYVFPSCSPLIKKHVPHLLKNNYLIFCIIVIDDDVKIKKMSLKYHGCY